MELQKVYSKSKYVAMSPQKVRLVVDLIRGESAEYAAEMLDFVNKAAARPVKKTIEAAIANAINNFEMDRKELKIIEARVDDAPILKRGRAVSKGRYHKILKRNSHIVIVLSDNKTEVKAGKKPRTAKPVKKAKATKVIDKIKGKVNKPVLLDKNLTKANQIKSGGTQRRVQAKG